MKKGVFILILGFSLLAHSQALGPEDLVKRVTQEVLDAVKGDAQLAAGDRQKMLKLAEDKVLPHIDFGEAARLALGRSWAKATPEQRKQVVAEFRAMLVRTYASAIDAYRGQTLHVLPVRMKPADSDVTVRNRYLRPGATPVMIEYQMHKTAQGWKIYDIVVEGVSLVITYRSEFDAVVKQDGIEGLIRRLTEKNTPPPLPG
jgi:phospholipid transport system substrate-binding protein